VSAISLLAALAPVAPASASPDEPAVMTFPAVADCDVKGGLGTTGTSYCTQPSMNVGYASGTVPLLPYARRGLVRFDVSALPAGVLVQDVALSLSLNGTKPYGAATVDVHEPGAAWTTSATWHTTDGTTPWPADGGAPSAVVAGTAAGPAAGRVTWTGPALKDLVLGWRAAPSANRGLLLKAHAEGPGELNLSFATSESPDPAARPVLTVRYATPPDAPVVTAVPGDRSLTASWTVPPGHGSPVLSYAVVTTRPDGSVADSATVTGTTHQVTGLANGTTYRVTVTATNAVGASPAGVSPPVVPRTVPSAPAGLVATPGVRSIELTWDGAAGNGAAVTGWVATVAGPDGSVTKHPSAGARSVTFADLPGGRWYTVSLAATNDAGTGPVATVVHVVPLDVPAAPAIVRAEHGDHSASVTWDWNVFDGGSPVESFTVRARDTDGAVAAETTAGRDTTTVDLTGLENGTPYWIEVAATNAVGTGPAARTAAVWPMPVPWRPHGVVSSADVGSVTVSWDAPAGGPAPESYAVVLHTSFEDDRVFLVPGDATSWHLDGLEDGRWYSATVVARNAVGDSPVAAPFGFVPGVRPATPQVVASASAGAVTVQWGPEGGLYYVVRLVRASDGAVVAERRYVFGPGEETFAAEPGVAYYATAVAVNAGSRYSDPATSDVVTPSS
jgi:hypothetical protein